MIKLVLPRSFVLTFILVSFSAARIGNDADHSMITDLLSFGASIGLLSHQLLGRPEPSAGSGGSSCAGGKGAGDIQERNPSVCQSQSHPVTDTEQLVPLSQSFL